MKNTTEKQYLISESLRNAVMNYLAIKPWSEVNIIMGALINTPEVIEQEIPKNADVTK